MRESMSLAFAVQATDPDAGTFSGMASVYNTIIDSWMPTRILPGAFTKTLAENAPRVKVLYQHNPDWLIGKPTKMSDVEGGLLVEAKVSATDRGKEALMLMRDGVLTDLSIGFDPIKTTEVDEGPMLGMVRHIQELRLWEFSPVTWGANRDARIESVNSLFQHMRPADIPDVLKRLLKDASPERAIEALGVVHTSIRELHEGKVLSAKNRTLVVNAVETMQSAVTTLQALLAAAEPADPDDQSLTVKREQLSRTITNQLAALDLALLDATGQSLGRH